VSTLIRESELNLKNLRLDSSGCLFSTDIIYCNASHNRCKTCSNFRNVIVNTVDSVIKIKGGGDLNISI
jgi:hypothetical protein